MVGLVGCRFPYVGGGLLCAAAYYPPCPELRHSTPLIYVVGGYAAVHNSERCHMHLSLHAISRFQEVICNVQAEESRSLKASCETDLAEALPALESAVSALKSLSKGDIVEASVDIVL